MKEQRYSVFLALQDISDEAILEAALIPSDAAIPLPSGQTTEPRRRGRVGLILPAMGWIAAAFCSVAAVGAIAILIRSGVILNPFAHPETSAEDATNEETVSEEVESSCEDTADKETVSEEAADPVTSFEDTAEEETAVEETAEPATSCEDTTEEETEPLIFTVWDGSVATGFAGGSGTASDPYLIETPAQLAYLAQGSYANGALATKSYRLEANLDLNGLEWIPIGTYASPFGGYFDGNGHAIKNLFLSQFSYADDYYVAGLFGAVKNGTIRNLILTDVNVEIHSMSSSYGKVYAGGLAGRLVATNGNEVSVTDCKLERVRVEAVDEYGIGAVDVYQGGVAGRIVIGEDGGFMGERLQAVEVSLYSMGGADLYQGILTGYTESHSRFELRDVCAEGVLGSGYNSGKTFFAAVSGAFDNDGGRLVCKNVFAVCNNPLGSGHIFTYQVYVDKSAKQTFSFENCFMGHTNGSGSNPTGHNELLYYAMEEYVTYRNCAYTVSLPSGHGFREEIWDVSDPRHPRLR